MPLKCYHPKETHAKKIYNSYTSSGKLRTKTFRPKKFQLKKKKKKKLILQSKVSIYNKLVLLKRQEYKKPRKTQVAMCSTSHLKF